MGKLCVTYCKYSFSFERWVLMSKKSSKHKNKLHNISNDDNFSSFPINSSLINIPIIPNMVNINSNIPKQDIKSKK